MKLLRRPQRRPKGAFTILEMIVVISIMAIVAGTAIPLASTAIHSKARRATLEELETLQPNVVDYFRDTGQLPTALTDLESDPGVTGWTGPYLHAFGNDRISGLSRSAVDAWSHAYRLESTTSTLTITSAGRSGAMDDGDDISVTIDVTSVRREDSLRTIEIVDRAIQLYNASWLTTDPLPADYSALLDKLVARGYLPAAAPFELDGWGDAFVPDPAGLTPVVQVTSTHLD